MVFLILILMLQCGVMALLKLLGISYDIEGLSLLFIAADCILFTLIGLMEAKKKAFYICYCATFFIRLSLLFIDYYFIRIMHSGSDTESFFETAAMGFDIKLTNYYLGLSAFFEVVGTTRIFAQFINLCCGMISCLLVLKILEVLHLNEKAKLTGFALACFLPNWVDMSVILIRESIIIMCVAVALYYFALWFENGNLSYLIFAFTATLPAVFLHSGVIAVTIVIAMSPLIYNCKTALFKINFQTFISLCGFGFLGLFFFIKYIVGLLPYFGSLNLNRLLFVQNYGIAQIGKVGSAYLENLQASTWFEFVLFTPIRWLYFYFSPMPLDWRGINDMIAFLLSGAPTLFIFIYAAIAVCTSRHNRHLLILLSIFIIAFGIVYSWGTFTAGTAMRHRDKIVPIYAVILSASYDARLKRRLDYRIPKRIIESIHLT